MKNVKLANTIGLFILALFCLCVTILAQTGGDITLMQAVIAGGGNSSSGGGFTLDSASGQALAGNALSGSPYAVTSGFWNFTQTAPTAVRLRLARVRTADSRGIRNAVIMLAAANGSSQTARPFSDLEKYPLFLSNLPARQDLKG